MPCKEQACDADAILKIWHKRISVGDAVYVKTAGNNITFLEGVVGELCFDKGYVAIKNELGLTYLPLADATYIERLCVKPCKKKDKKKDKKDKKEKCYDDVRRNIWANVNVGDVVFVQDNQGEGFVGTVDEVNIKSCYVGIRTASGVTYIPFANIPAVRVTHKVVC